MTPIDRAASLEQLLDAGWDYHDSESERLARELEAAVDQEVTADLVAPFIQLATHTIGEHLGDWRRALALGKRVLDDHAPTPGSARAWARLSVAATLAGDVAEAAALELRCLEVAGDDVGAALLDMRFLLVAALVGARRADEAGRVYRAALALVGQIRETLPLQRMIAVASNNLGWELYEMPARTAEERALMLLCAETSLDFWGKGGGWINIEQAHYLAALVANAAGDAAAGLAHGDAGLAIIAANGARPLDAALLHLARAASLAALGDDAGSGRAVGDADSCAAMLTAPDLRARFHAERDKLGSI